MWEWAHPPVILWSAKRKSYHQSVMTGGIFMLFFGKEGIGLIEIRVNACGISLQGHAGHHENGRDLVCAAVSALTCNLINSLRELSKDEIQIVCLKSGDVTVSWQQLSDKGKLLVDSWFLGIAAINQKYNCIKFE